ncbi:MAG: universal stress protein [Halobacteriota archaeon]
MYDVVVLPTDGEPNSQPAVEHAVELARLHSAELHVLHAVDESLVEVLDALDDEDRSEEDYRRSLERRGERAVDEAVEKADAVDVSAVGELRYGSPEDVVVGYAEEVDADLVVMGTKHQPEEYREILGSVTERVLRRTPRTVSVVKA